MNRQLLTICVKRGKIMIFLAVVMFSCRVPYEQPRVKVTKVEIHSGKFSEYEIKSFIRQKPNKKILFFIPFHLAVHNMAWHMKDRTPQKSARIDKKIDRMKKKGKTFDGTKMNKKKERTLRNWLMHTVGEPPVLYDSLQTSQTVKQMELYLHTTGHFQSHVETVVLPSSNERTATVEYHVHGGQPFTIVEFRWETADENLRSILEQLMEKSLISEGKQYNEDMLDDERDRIAAYFRNHGFYHFNKSFITYTADTSLGNQSMLLTMKISLYPQAVKGQINEVNHPRSKVGNIYFNMDFMHNNSNAENLDTLAYEYKRSKKDSVFSVYYFVYENVLKFKPRILLKKCFIKTGDLVSIENAMKTNNGISSLGNFRYINIRFKETIIDNDGFTIMDVYIDLSRIQKQSFSTDLEGTNSAGNLGVSANLSYRNRNTLRGAEMLSVKLRGAIEAQTVIGAKETEEDQIIERLPFNTIEGGVEVDLTFPKFMMPFTDRLFNESNVPKTVFTSGAFFQQRPDYTRYIGNLAITYEWRESGRKHHMFSPAFINLVRIFPDSLFLARIEQFSRPLQSSYKDHLISGMRYTYTFTTKTTTKSKNYMYFRSNLETAGNLARLYSVVIGDAEPGETYSILGIRFAQYTRGDIDYRQYLILSEKSSLVFRCFTGIGYAYGNINVMPFDKRYSAGGANDIRAWKFRSLGPGTYSDSLKFDKTGDLAIVLNLEYRFPIYDILHSALFIDAGNVWMLKEYEDYPGGEFNPEEFHKEIAIGAGMGIRLNFGYFIFRLDAGFPLHDPALPEGDRWLGVKGATKRLNLNFGIGYPF